jgi:3-phosphoshikimate 1-carboxyvinyltransferase
MAMALAVAGLRAASGVVIEGAECVGKSYPRFFEDLAGVGGRIHE